MATTFSPTKLTYGQKSTVTGKVTDATTGAGVSGQTIYLYGRVKGDHDVRQPGGEGHHGGERHVHLHHHPAHQPALLRHVARRLTAWAPASPTKAVTVKATVTMSMNHSTVHALTKVTFTGIVRPKTAGVVQLQRLQGSTWVTKKTARRSPRGSTRSPGPRPRRPTTGGASS